MTLPRACLLRPEMSVMLSTMSTASGIPTPPRAFELSFRRTLSACTRSHKCRFFMKWEERKPASSTVDSAGHNTSRTTSPTPLCAFSSKMHLTASVVGRVPRSFSVVAK